ncbi:MAG: ATP-dependent helicase HrpB [Erythrobacter sp.]
MSPDLPIHDVLQELFRALSGSGSAVLIAPPGAGKTTAVAPALLKEAWCEGQIILTSPRRVAARAAAERMAEMAGEKVGETFGYATRLETKKSDRTRVLVVTEGIFVNRILADPELPGISAIVFDEAHERHLDCDLGLALAIEARNILREDLRVLVMSATIDGSRFASLLGDDAQIIESEGRSYPLDIKWLGRDPNLALEDQMATACVKVWRETEDQDAGSVLVFLPGVREIERVRERLTNRLSDVPIHVLHGQVDPPAQRAAIKQDPNGRRRIVLASAIAETSLTLDGVNLVIDSGLARMGEYDSAAGTTRLVTRPASQAAATQRAGRAARQRPGSAFRLWEEHSHASRPEFSPPEIETADLAPLVLSLADWGTRDPKSLAWLDLPSDAAIAIAREKLRSLGAVDDDGAITNRGRIVASLPLDPAGAAAVLAGAEAGQGEDAAKLVLLSQERALGGRGEDLLQRLSRWNGDRSPRANSSRKLAQNWARAAAKRVKAGEPNGLNPALFLALARPSMVAKRRDSSGEHWLASSGRGFWLDPTSTLARSEWLVIADAQGHAKGARITAGAALSQAEITENFREKIEECQSTHWNKVKNKIDGRIEKKFGAITISSAIDPKPDEETLVGILVEKALENLGERFPESFLSRAKFAEIPALSIEQLGASADFWLAPILIGRRDLNLAREGFAEAALSQLDWDQRQALEKRAPTHFVSPANSRHAVNYAGDDSPNVEVRVQALFGLDTHPMIGSTPLLLKLTSPAGRPIQSTRDLPKFWRGSWSDVVKDMKGRYPKHRWPEKPWTEKPSLKTKNAFNRD